MSGWTHAQCYDCWRKERGEKEMPVRYPDHEPTQCCFCGRWTVEGIFTRKDPKLMKCKHEEED